MPKLSDLASVSATKQVLERYGLATKKAFGQHFLINDGIISRICDLAQLKTEDCVLEVGPGIGTLTLALLQKAGFVFAIERDRDLPIVLADTCAAYANKFVLIEKDALDLCECDLKHTLASAIAKADTNTDSNEATPASMLPHKFVANLPYAVAATLILNYFERFPSLNSATLMIQSEVADRICAQPGTKAYGAYTVKLSLYAKVNGRFSVGPQNFFPPPRVESAVIRLDRTKLLNESGQLLDEKVLKSAALMADAAFANRRKTILNSCKTYFSQTDDKTAVLCAHLPDIFKHAHIDARVRGETLSKEAFIALGQAALCYL